MTLVSIITTRRQRLLSIFLAGLLLTVLQVSSGVLIATQGPVSSTFWVFYACYGVGAFLFYCIGSFCWLYAYEKQHTVASLLFGFTTCVMISFSSLSVSATGVGTFSALSVSSIALASFFLFLLLLYFPYTIAATLRRRSKNLLRIVRLALSVLCAFTILRNISVFLFHYHAPDWWFLLSIVYYLLTAIAIIVVIIYHVFRRGTSVRQQQQARLFFLGTLLSFVPILGVTILPTIFHLRLVVDGTLSALFLVLFPFTLGYSVLRYRLLIFDTYVKHVVTILVSMVGLALLTFGLFAVESVLVSNIISFPLAILLLVGVLSAPCVWWSGKLLTEQVFFPEAQYYKRVLKHVQQNRAEQSFDLQHVAHLLVIDTMTTLNTPGACVFILDEQTHAYTLLATPSHEAEQTERVRGLLLAQSAGYLSSGQTDQQINVKPALVQQLQEAKRPLFLSEVKHSCEKEESITYHISFPVKQQTRSGPLFAPLRSPQGEMIGIMLLSERGDEQRYGGSDLEALVQLLHISAMAIETARQFHITMREQKRTAREVEEAYQQQRRLTEMKDQLIIHMSHELRTPLAEVIGYLALLSDYGERLNPEQRALFTQKAVHGSEELLQLLSTILDAAQSDTSKVSLTIEPVSVNSVVQQEVMHLDPALTQHHTVSVQIDEQFVVQANEQAVRQVVRNLLTNALKYSPAHTNITICATSEHGVDTLSVKDEGSGISQEEMSLLFQKFVRLPRHHSGSIRGSGLGLHISKQMVEAIGGQIWAESSGREGEGTTFFVRFAQTERFESKYMRTEQSTTHSKKGHLRTFEES